MFPDTIPELVALRTANATGSPFLFFEGDSWTLADLAGEVDRIAVGLAERGVEHGDRVLVALGNRPDTLFAWFAINRLGAVFVPVDPASKPTELAGLLRLTKPRMVVVDEYRALVESACAELSQQRPALATRHELAQAGTRAPTPTVGADDVAVLLATSGSTGAPKGVMLTHRTFALTAEAFPFWIGLDATDRVLAALPFFHVNALAYSVMGALGAGASLAIGPRFSASRFFTEAKRLGATQVNVVGAMVHILLKTAASPADRDHALRLVYAALALPEAQHRSFEQRFGVSMTVGYGLSETTFGTVWPLGSAPRYGTMGTLRQHPSLGIVNVGRVVRDDGTDAGDDEVGELVLENPALMRGYFEDPERTADVLQHGWFKTGDLVRRDAEGFYTFVARKKDVIRRRGENVAAAEIEGVLCSHPAVLEAAAIGVPSELGEDDIVAFVAPKPGATIDVEDLRAWALARLADFKVPSKIHVRDALPRTATARVQKHLLK